MIKNIIMILPQQNNNLSAVFRLKITHFNGWMKQNALIWRSWWKWWSFGIFYNSVLRDETPSEVSKLSLTAGTSTCPRATCHVPSAACDSTRRNLPPSVPFTASWPPYLQRNGWDLLTRRPLGLVTNYFRFHIWTFCRALDGFKW